MVFQEFFALIQPTEIQLILFLQSFQSDLLNLLFQGITFLGNPIPWMLLAAFIYWKGEENESFFLSNLILLTTAITGMIKVGIARPRPSSELVKVLDETYFNLSFPSNHAAIASGLLGYYSKVKHHFVWTLLVMALLVGLSRMYLGVHYLSDVIVGLILGFFIGLLNWNIRERFIQHKFKLTKLVDEIALVLIVLLFLVSIFFVSIIEYSSSLLGFYFGFFLLKEIEFNQSKLENKNSLIKKQLIGFLLLLGIVALGFYLKEPLIKSFVFFFSGLWISAVYPFLFEKFSNKK